MGKQVRPYSNGNEAQLTERRLRAFELKKLGWSDRRIAAELGVSHGTVQNDIKKMRDEYLIPAVESYRKQLLSEIDDQLTRLRAKLNKPQYITTAKGEYAVGPDGEPMINEEYQLKVEDRISRLMEQRAKLVGAYAPAQVETTVHQVDPMDLALQDIINSQKAKNSLAKGKTDSQAQAENSEAVSATAQADEAEPRTAP